LLLLLLLYLLLCHKAAIPQYTNTNKHSIKHKHEYKHLECTALLLKF